MSSNRPARTLIPDRAPLVARYKSAKYTVERPLHIGASLAGAPPNLIATLSAYGLPLGEAFQLRDDVLGVFGDPQTTESLLVTISGKARPTSLPPRSSERPQPSGNN
jgi:geranylgeranyl diphosphate synthase type I